MVGGTTAIAREEEETVVCDVCGGVIALHLHKAVAHSIKQGCPLDAISSKLLMISKLQEGVVPGTALHSVDRMMIVEN